MEKIFEFERSNPDVSKLKINGTLVWTVFRFQLKFLLLRQRLSNGPSGARFKLGRLVRSVQAFVKDAVSFAGSIPVIFRKYRYIVVTNNLEVRSVDGKRVDKLAHNLIQTVGEKDTLVLCYGSKSRSDIHSYRYCIKASFIDWLARFYRFSVQVDESDQQLLNQVQQNFGMNEIVMDEVAMVMRKAKVIHWLLGIWNPRVLVSCCYSNYAEIFAANQSGVYTLEMQHGIIGPLHAGYESSIPLNKSFTSRALWTFGWNSTRGLSGNLVDLNNVWPIGNYYLESIAAKERADHEFKHDNGLAVCVPVDAYTEEHILGFLLKVAEHLPHVVFYVNPRVQLSEKMLSAISDSTSFRVISDMPFQMLVRNCDAHTATDSTCCLEALSLGIQNVLINDNGSAFRYYGDLVDPAFTKFANDYNEYIQFMNNLRPASPVEIVASNRGNFMPNNLERIREGLANLEAC